MFEFDCTQVGNVDTNLIRIIEHREMACKRNSLDDLTRTQLDPYQFQLRSCGWAGVACARYASYDDVAKYDDVVVVWYGYEYAGLTIEYVVWKLRQLRI